MIANLPLEIRMIIFREIVSLNAISKDMKAELQNKWFNLFYDKAWQLIHACQYDQCMDIVLFLRNTVSEKDMKSEFHNRIELIQITYQISRQIMEIFERPS